MGDSPPQIHESLVPTDDAAFELRAPASVVKPIFAYADALVDELRLHVSDDGLRYEVVDAANVAMCSIDVPAAAFDTFDAEELTTGLNVGRMTTSLRAGRQRQDDDIHLSYADRHLSTTVQREYDGAHMDLQATLATIDPDSIRQEPDLPDLDLPATATIQRAMLRDAVDAASAITDHVRFATEGDALEISGEGATDTTVAVIRDAVDGGDGDSQFSMDYTRNMLDSLAAVGADEITMELGEEFPMRVEWTTEWNDAEVSGVWFQAPRIQS